MTLSLAPPRRPRRPSLTPMIDVVFLLLVFFMLAARFGADGIVALSLAGTADGTAYSGAPRVVDVLPEGVRLNGVPLPPEALAAGLAPLIDGPGDPIVLRARDGAELQRVIDTMTLLRAGGLGTFVMVE